MLTGQLPGGWKQRVAFGAAVMHEPKVIFLDEPTSGVDPLARRVMWRMINELADHGAAILVVTHYLEEAEQCNRIGFMVAGEIIARRQPRTRSKRASRAGCWKSRRPRRSRPFRSCASATGQAASRCSGTASTSSSIPMPQPNRSSANCKEHDIEVRRAELTDFSLEDVFISLIEKRRQQIPQ